MEEQTPSNPPNTYTSSNQTLQSIVQEPKKKFGFLRFLILGILFVLVVVTLGVSSFLLASHSKTVSLNKYKQTNLPTPTPTSDPTTGWKTYTDEKYHFSMRYPADYVGPLTIGYPDTFSSSNWQIGFNARVQTTAKGIVLNPNESYGDGLRIELFSNPNELSAADFIQKVAFVNTVPGWDNASNAKQPTTLVHLPNSDAVRIEKVAGGAGSYGPVAFIADGTWMIEVEAKNLSKTNQAIFDAALPTFTFTSVPTPTPTPITVSSNLKYTDKYFGYSIFYPTQWILKRTYDPDIPKGAPTDILSAIELDYDTLINGSPNQQATVVVNVLDRHNMSDIQSWISQYDLNYPKNATKTNTTFNTFPAIKYTDFTESNHPTEYIYFLKGNYAYRLEYWEQAGISDNTRTIINSFTP